jgi:sulfide:quinone oxidoreductase
MALTRAVYARDTSTSPRTRTTYPWAMSTSVLILGAGFGGLELSTRLSEGLGDQVDITLIDRADSFIFGFSKLDVMFGKQTPDAVRLHYRDLTTPQVRFRQGTITAIDPARRQVVTDVDSYDFDATPGLVAGGNEFYSVPGAETVRDLLPSFTAGAAIVGVCGAPFKCPPAPSEAAFLLDEFLRGRGVRVDVSIQVVIPFGTPIPPSPATSEAILGAFAERHIEFVPDRRVASLDPDTSEAVLDDGRRLPFDLFLGIPVHRAPAVVEDAGLTENGWIPVDPRTLATRFPGVYAVGDVTSVGTPKAGVFAERQASAVADQLIAWIRGASEPPGYDGTGTCYVEFGDHEVGRVDVDFYSTPGHPTGTFVTTSRSAGGHAGSEAERLQRLEPAYSVVSTTSTIRARGSEISVPCTRSHIARSDASMASASDSVSNSRSIMTQLGSSFARRIR